MRPLTVMLDLENTLIDSWHSGCVLSRKSAFVHNTIKKILPLKPIANFGIFSFAIDNDKEIDHGIVLAQMALPEFPINKSWVVPFDKIEQLVKFGCCNDLQKWELINLFGKHDMFLKWAAQFPQNDFILFDDALPFNTETISRDKQVIDFFRV